MFVISILSRDSLRGGDLKTLIVLLGLLSFKAFAGDFDPWRYFQFKTIKDFNQHTSSSWGLAVDPQAHLPLTDLWEGEHLESLKALIQRFGNAHQVDFLVFYLSNLSAYDLNFLSETIWSHSYFLDFVVELKRPASLEALEMAVISNMNYSSRGVIDDLTVNFLTDPLHQDIIRKVTNIYQIDGLFDFWNIFFNRLLYVSDEAHPYLQVVINENSELSQTIRKKVDRLYKFILKIEDPLAIELLRTIYAESISINSALNDGDRILHYVARQANASESAGSRVLSERLLNQKNWNPILAIKNLIDVLNHWGDLDLVQSEKDLELAKLAIKNHFSRVPGNHLSNCFQALKPLFQ